MGQKSEQDLCAPHLILASGRLHVYEEQETDSPQKSESFARIFSIICI